MAEQHHTASVGHAQYVDADTSSWERLLMRGEIFFRAAKIEESIKDFDKSIELNPRSAPYNWQRGISLYYAKRFEEGQKQFETHRSVNRNDVENSVWHFLCVAKQKGIDEARKGLIPIEQDGRPPMMEVMRMFSGETTPEKVVALAEEPKLTGEGKRMAQFYGYLYVGLYFDALGETDKATLYLKKCLEQKMGGYMADVARVHFQLNKK